MKKKKKSQMKSKINVFFLTVIFCACFNIANSQNLQILKDSILISNSYHELQELKIDLKNEQIQKNIYRNIQSAYDIFDGIYFDTPEQRLKSKKDTISNRISNNTLRETNTGFEHFEIYFDKKKIVNFSIRIQSYGSSWEDVKYYCFDLNNGTRITSNFFINKNILVKKIICKLKLQGLVFFVKFSNLSNFKIATNNYGKVSGIDFSLIDTKNHRNSGYEEFIVHFSWQEIQKFISPLYKNSLI